MFAPFHRAGQENGPIAGTGIGLAITKRLAEMMHGVVGFRSVSGEGSQFWVDLPALDPELAASSAPPGWPHKTPLSAVLERASCGHDASGSAVSTSIKGTEERGELPVVKTILVTDSRDRVPLDYLMRREGNTWRAVDFSVQGVSLVNHYRKSFARFLVNHSFEELLAKLRPRATRT